MGLSDHDGMKFKLYRPFVEHTHIVGNFLNAVIGGFSFSYDDLVEGDF